MRRELNGLVAAWYHRTGQPHGVTHAALRKECGGPAGAPPPTPPSWRSGSTCCATRVGRLRLDAAQSKMPE